MSAHIGVHYPPWRRTRLEKLQSLFGVDFFKDKKVLEVGAGLGLIGKHIRDIWDADVYFTDGRIELVRQINSPNAVLIDHDHDWKLPHTFDFIIHWGTLYHLDNWKNDLRITVDHLKSGGILAYEGEILDSSEDEEVKVGEAAQVDGQVTQERRADDDSQGLRGDSGVAGRET